MAWALPASEVHELSKTLGHIASLTAAALLVGCTPSKEKPREDAAATTADTGTGPQGDAALPTEDAARGAPDSGATADQGVAPDENGPASEDGLAFAALFEASAERPRFRFEGGLPASVDLDVPLPPGDDVLAGALSFLETYKALYRLENPARDLFPLRVAEAEGESHLFLGQRHRGLPVLNAALAMDVVDGRVRATRGRWIASMPILGAAKVTSPDALALALRSTEGQRTESAGDPRLVVYDPWLFGGEASSPGLAWSVSIFAEGGLRTVIIDATNGAVRNSIDEVTTEDPEKDFYIQTGNGSFSSNCWNWTSDDDEWFDEDGEDGYPGADFDPFLDGLHAWELMHSVYDWFHGNFGRNGMDDDDGQHEAIAHVTYPAGSNASFTGGCPLFMFSDGYVVRDIFGHEFGHAIDYFSSDLVYQNQSGALDESFADVFAMLIDPADFTIGEALPGVPLRDMSDPPRRGQPDHMSGFAALPAGVAPNAANDNGGVHGNSGIPNKAAWLLVQGGQHQGYRVSALGRAKVAWLYYGVITTGLTSGSQFVDARDALVSYAGIYASTGRHGFEARDDCQVKNAFASVGIRSDQGDSDCDGVADTAEADDDGDGTTDLTDNCPHIANVQVDTDRDWRGDACDADDDNDTVLDVVDNCPLHSNEPQTDSAGDRRGDPCDDHDGDSLINISDNCPDVRNSEQKNTDGDAQGDACDDDDDNDGRRDEDDLCPRLAGESGVDTDGDRVGDDCDNCVAVANPDQQDCDGDGIGSACEAPDDRERVYDGGCFPRPRYEIPALPGTGFPIPTCLSCPNWFNQDWRTLIDVVTNGGGPIVITDERGHVVARSRGGEAQQRLAFRPAPAALYSTPGQETGAFQSRQYFIRAFPGPNDSPDRQIQLSVDVQDAPQGR